MKSWFGKLIPVIFLCAFFFTTFSLFTIFTNVATLQTSEQMADNTRIIENTIHKTYFLVVRAENQQRNYILTGNFLFLKEYQAKLTEITSTVNKLSELTKATPRQQQNMIMLRKLIPQRIEYLQEGINVRQQSTDLTGLTPIFENGSQTMQAIQTVTQSMITQEDTLLRIEEEAAKKEYQTIYTNSILTFFGDMLIITIAFYFLRKEFQQRTELEQTKDDFINLASHELNTPITSLKIFSKVLRNKLSSEKNIDTKRYLDKMDEQTNKLTMLITDLLDISRIQTGKIHINKERFSLSSLIQETVEGLQGTTLIHTIKTKQRYEKDIFADRYRIYQVLVNLLSNAIKYSPKGGMITLSTMKKGKDIVVSVSDTGIGIDKKYQQKIFERLYQVTDVREKTFPGLGIGLFISREIIGMHGGRMWVESEKGRGSTFYFTLPS